MHRSLVGLLIGLFFALALSTGQETPGPVPDPGHVTLPDTPGYRPIEITSDTKGVDFRPYLQDLLVKVEGNWYNMVPVDAMPPLLRRGTVVLGFQIAKDGKLQLLHYVAGSGDVAMDRAAYAGIVSSTPFAPLPAEFKGEYLGLRFTFKYNPGTGGRVCDEDSLEQVRLSEILVSTQDIPPDDERQAAAARTRAEVLLGQIQSGVGFEDVAKKNPDDPSAFRGVDLGFFHRCVLPKPIEDEVFKLKTGDVTGVIQTKQGFVILKVTQHIPSTPAAPVTK